MLRTVIEDLKKYSCTGFSGVPSHFQILLRKTKLFKEDDFPDLRYVTQAGGKLANPIIEEFIEYFPDVKFYVMYGQTEATSRLSYLPPELVKEKMGSIGKGIPGVMLSVLNEKGEKVQVGEVGQIYASGENVMMGYFNDQSNTSLVLQDGKLVTGDLATVDEDGFIFIVGREKEIVKVGGKRVSPKEIENVIIGISDVVDCSIIAVDDDVLGEALKAYIILKKNSNIDKNYIQRICREKLSSQMIPKFIEFSDKMPVHTTGKKLKSTIDNLKK
jgi:acyl-CoA synthetase (AMP-forming)/AMP-acid ligase II